MNNIDRYYTMVLIILWLLVHSFLFQHYGFRQLFDSTAYLNRADFLIQHHLLEGVRDIFYAVPISIIALFRILFHENIFPYLLFQCIISGLATIALYQSSSTIFNSPLAGLFSGIIFLVWIDNIHWNVTVMTESWLCSFTCFLLFLLTHFKNTIKNYGLILIVTLIILFTRPTGVVVVAGVTVFFLKYHWSMLSGRPSLKVVIVIGLLLVSYLGVYSMFTFWDFTEQFNKGNMVTYIDTISKNSPLYRESLRIKPDDIELLHSNNHALTKLVGFMFYDPIYVVKTGGIKIWYLLSATRPYYSLSHNLYAISWGTLIYLLCYQGSRKTTVVSIKVFVLTVVIVNCCLFGIFTIDWDNRFFIPMEPGLVVLAGGGAAYVVKVIGVKSKNVIA